MSRRLSPRALVCEVSGEVDSNSAQHLREHLVGLIRVSGPDLVVDLDGVRLLAAAGLGVLAEAAALAAAAGVRMPVVASTRQVLLPLALTELDLVLDVHRNVTDVRLRSSQHGPRRRAPSERRRPARPPVSSLSNAS
ncbi:STAS domain-containing protein [Actinosynnema pretiosum]|uniref:STAS domain-containing protein n=1 Tax=Actinosynnema pretiosum TaxID=42197 RepID=UPI0018DF5B3D|nr:STAS domain-containing protein [Actinosynnema pretiosum]